jgi:pimeloyl-ACP methyl ester carboxylesterase
VIERGVVAAGVPGWLWLPECPPRALVLAGHGLGRDKRSVFGGDALLRLPAEHGVAVAAFDAPGHGERRGGESYREQWRRVGGREIARELARAVDALQADLGPSPLGYWGLSLATQYGLAFLGAEPRVRAAVLGLFRAGPRVLAYAARVRCPVWFVRQEDDELHPAGEVGALFDALGSTEKQLASSPGRHEAVPAPVLDQAVAFLVRHLV